LDKHPDPVQAIYAYILRLADKIEEKQFAAGNPLSIVAIESAVASERISQACRQVYTQLQSAFEEKMTSSGMSPTLANEKACLIMVSLEGGILLSRVQRTADPMRTLAAHIRESIQDATLPKSESP
jgi:TetR/AcrR family transcriptional repressor of lmrAB and yxaGH operons